MSQHSIPGHRSILHLAKNTSGVWGLAPNRSPDCKRCSHQQKASR